MFLCLAKSNWLKATHKIFVKLTRGLFLRLFEIRNKTKSKSISMTSFLHYLCSIGPLRANSVKAGRTKEQKNLITVKLGYNEQLGTG